MVRFQAASGNVAAKLVARGKHFVLFDEPADKGAILKESYPDLGWTTSIEGHPTLPYSVAWRLLLRGCAERDRRDVLLFGEFATAQLFSRIFLDASLECVTSTPYDAPAASPATPRVRRTADQARVHQTTGA